MDETTTAENSPLESLRKNGLGRAKKFRGAVQAMLVPPATTDSATLRRYAADQEPNLAELQSGDLAARVEPSHDALDLFPDEHPWAAIPFATDELQPVTFDAPPTTFVAEQVTPQAAAFTRRLPLAQYQNMLAVPADMRPRRIWIRPIGAGNMYVHLIRPQGDGSAANLDVGGFLMVSTDSPLELQCTGEVWVVSDTATQYANVIVDYSAVEATRIANVLADRMGSVLASSKAPCGCGSH